MATDHDTAEPDREPLDPADAVRVRRVPERASYDRDTIDPIIDACYVAHVGTVRDGVPVVIPMFVVRDGDDVLLHGAPASGSLRRGPGATICATFTLLDGLVLARSALHHSMNYRSVVVIGDAVEVTDPAEKTAALDRFTEALAPGRLAHLRPMTDKEMRGTSVLRLSLATASAKCRSGWPVDDEDDEALPIWAGVVPIRQVLGEPKSDPKNLEGVAVPDHVTALVR